MNPLRLALAAAALALCSCATTTGTATAPLAASLASVRRDTAAVHEQVRADLGDLRAIESDGKQILRILHGQ